METEILNQDSFKIVLIFFIVAIIGIEIIPLNAKGNFINNINIPSEIEPGKKFNFKFDAIYNKIETVYAYIGLCDTEGSVITDDKGLAIILSEERYIFYVTEKVISHSISCKIPKDIEQGTYKLGLAVYDSETDDAIIDLSSFTNEIIVKKKVSSPSEVTSESGGNSLSTLICYSIMIIFIIVVVVIIVILILDNKLKQL